VGIQRKLEENSEITAVTQVLRQILDGMR